MSAQTRITNAGCGGLLSIFVFGCLALLLTFQDVWHTLEVLRSPFPSKQQRTKDASPYNNTMNASRTTEHQLNDWDTIVSGRSDRFPSATDRVKLYMSNWYLPPCKVDENRGNLSSTSPAIQYRYEHEGGKSSNNTSNSNESKSLLYVSNMETPLERYELNSTISGDMLFYLDNDDRSIIERCAQNQTWNLHGYCNDISGTVFAAMDRIGWDNDTTATAGPIPLIFQLGDGAISKNYGYVTVPHLRKFRLALSQSEVDRVSKSGDPRLGDREEDCVSRSRRIPETADPENPHQLQPILWKLNTVRHYGRVNDAIKEDKTPWKDKIDKMVFRGAMTGSGGHQANATTEENCLANERCRFVYQYTHSNLVDARLTGRMAPESVNGIPIVADHMSLRDMLAYKAILILEGNDVSSGLKWALRSRLVVLMKPPTLTSWAMEELLEPWVHFVPIRSDLTDVEEKMQWVLDHDEEAQTIAKRGALWMYDLLSHPDAEKENRWINNEILRRYRALFVRG